MRMETLLVICNPPQILLGLKNPDKKFGGMWNGWGGGIENGESPKQAAIREAKEEANITPINPKRKGEILFHFYNKEQDHRVYIFVSQKYEGILTPSQDFLTYQRFNIGNLPENMMPADRYWMPFLLKKPLFKGEIFFKENTEPQVNIYEVTSLE